MQVSKFNWPKIWMLMRLFPYCPYQMCSFDMTQMYLKPYCVAKMYSYENFLFVVYHQIFNSTLSYCSPETGRIKGVYWETPRIRIIYSCSLLYNKLWYTWSYYYLQYTTHNGYGRWIVGRHAPNRKQHVRAAIVNSSAPLLKSSATIIHWLISSSCILSVLYDIPWPYLDSFVNKVLDLKT